jgi:hypothetical protein
MVHAKASKKPAFVSAGALHEVCSQAAKQVGTIGQFGPIAPKQITLWHDAWEGPGGEGTVDTRLRVSKGPWNGLDGPAIWARLNSLLSSQSTDREVVMVLGAALDIDRLFAQAQKAKPPSFCTRSLASSRPTSRAITSTTTTTTTSPRNGQISPRGFGPEVPTRHLRQATNLCLTAVRFYPCDESANSTPNGVRAIAVTPDVTRSASADHGKVGLSGPRHR